MALPSNNKIVGDLGHTADHNAIVDEINFIKNNYLSASVGGLEDYLRKDTASSLYSTIVSPSFSGIPLAPTAASGSNNNQIANTSFVRNEISNLVSSAPSTLDTLNELAAALNNDPNFATTITTLISNKLDSSTASSIYLSQADAQNTYFPKSASGVLLTKNEASNTYLTISSSGQFLTETEASGTYLRQDTASSIYLPISASFNPEGYLTEATASSVYLSKNEASLTYLPISASSNFSPEGYLTSSAAAIIYAPIISPNLTGIPTAPTASAGTVNTQIATTEFVSIAVLAAQSGSVDLSAYLLASTASMTYLRQDVASNTYLSQSTASTTYLRQDTASSTYFLKNGIIDGGTP